MGSLSPGLRAASYPGCDRREVINPERVASPGRPAVLPRGSDTTLSGLAGIIGGVPRVGPRPPAPAVQPWAEWWNPLGIRGRSARSRQKRLKWPESRVLVEIGRFWAKKAVWRWRQEGFWRRETTVWWQETTVWRQETTVWRRDATAWRRDAMAWRRDAMAWRRDAMAWRRDATAWWRDATAWWRDATAWRRDAMAWWQDAMAWWRDAMAWRRDAMAWRHGWTDSAASRKRTHRGGDGSSPSPCASVEKHGDEPSPPRS